MIEKTVEFQEVKICTEHTGKENDPAILLMMGATASMLWWDEEFCERLAEKGYFVIRYDNRDVGKSTAYPPGIPPYTLEDLVHDVIRVLDAYNIRSEEHTSELQSRENLVCRLLLEKKNEYLWCRCTVELG